VRSELGQLLDVVRPNLIAFTQKEVWPGLTAAATERGIPTVLFAARLAPGARRLRPMGRRLLRPTFASLASVFAIDEADTPRFAQLGVVPDRVRITGDPGVDSAWERVRAADPHAAHLRPFADHPMPILVAGSTWPTDEDVLVPALASLRSGGGPPLTVILAPHEPTESHLDRIDRDLARAGIPAVRLAEVERRGRVEAGGSVVVDRVGVLAHLYTIGSFAYVGGGFHRAGLHSVLEPAAAGLPVLFGPRHLSSHGALDLLAAGGAKAVKDQGELAAVLRTWTSDRLLREAIGGNAAGYVERQRGAARRTAEALAGYLVPREVSLPGS
jgi:3-deoxy-D-manno-octulosonic-acid transferase